MKNTIFFSSTGVILICALISCNPVSSTIGNQDEAKSSPEYHVAA